MQLELFQSNAESTISICITTTKLLIANRWSIMSVQLTYRQMRLLRLHSDVNPTTNDVRQSVSQQGSPRILDSTQDSLLTSTQKWAKLNNDKIVWIQTSWIIWQKILFPIVRFPSFATDQASLIKNLTLSKSEREILKASVCIQWISNAYRLEKPCHMTI